MTLKDQYQAHFIDGGAYRRDAWPEGLYWRYNAKPHPVTTRTGGADESTPTGQCLWSGNSWSIVRPFWSQAYISPREANMDDWQWISQQMINNITNTSQSDPIAPTNVGKKL